MCIIASKPAGVEMPDEATLMTMFINNPDGAGLMYAMNNTVNIEKGFMRYEDFEKRLIELDAKYSLKRMSVVMHFRIATHGGVTGENCHPFPVTDNLTLMGKKRSKTNLAIAHNGIIDITPRNKYISDTMEYVASQLAPLSRAMPQFYKNKHAMQMVSNAIDSKMVIMDGKGALYYIGRFEDENGVKYSNGSYRTMNKWRSMYYAYEDPYSAAYGTQNPEFEVDTSYVNYERKRVMWLDEATGEFALTENNSLINSDVAIDEDNKVYYYSEIYGAIKLWSGARAFDGNANALKFNSESDMVSTELAVVF